MSRGPRDIKEFTGRWRLAREIEDRQGARRGTLEGFATLQDTGGHLTYLEEGTLSFPGLPALSAERTYLWQRGEGTEIKVLFEDGRDFHSFSLGRTMPEAAHHCAPDMYHVTYDFSAWPRWTTTWRVQGPRKDYRMVSRYRRQI